MPSDRKKAKIMKIRENANISVFYESQRNFNFIIEHCCLRLMLYW